MSSGYEWILSQHVLVRLTTVPALVVDMTNVRRAHRTIIPKLAVGSYAVHLIDGNDEPTKSQRRTCGARKGGFSIFLFARDDAGPTVLDELKVEVNRRLEPTTANPYPAGVAIRQGRIAVDTEIADEDSVRLDLDFELSYPTANEWSLEYAEG